MAYQDMRDWMATLEEKGLLKRITTEVDWNLELGAITRRVADREGPALLFENIKGYQSTPCRRLFAGGLASRERLALALGLPGETGYREIITFMKQRLEKRMDPVKVASGPVKENIIRGDAVNLYDLPVPMWNPLDGGRYINTYATQVTMDPDTKIMNLGTYRGMLGDDEKSIPVLLSKNQHWGHHFSKYEERGEDMPVAVVYGWDPTFTIYSGTALVHPDCSEYELLGGLRGEPVKLVKCETSDLWVPASAEIVVEGRISPDPKTYQMEGPFGEYPGFYAGVKQPKPVIHVDCITHRNAPIFRGGIVGHSPGHASEGMYWLGPAHCAIIWRALELAGVPNVTGVWGPPLAHVTNLRVQINKIYRGHAKQVAAIVWGLPSASHRGKNLIVVDKDIDIFDDAAVEWAMAYRTNAAMGAVQLFHGTPGGMLDPSVPHFERDVPKYGGGKWTRLFIDATVNWDLEPQAQYGGKREPPLCTEIDPKTAELINRKWKEYGL